MYGVPEQLIDEFVAAAAPDIDQALRRSIEELAPPPPFWLRRDQESLRRWTGASLAAAGIALHQSAADPSAAAQFALVTARVLYGDPTFTM